MRFEEHPEGKVFVTKVLDNRITADASGQLKEKIVSYVAQGYKYIVVDLSEVTFIDSSGLGALISSLKLVGDDGKLAVSGTKSTVLTTFKLTRMDRVFPMFDRQEEAVAALSQ